jgi:hypothetical protein
MRNLDGAAAGRTMADSFGAATPAQGAFEDLISDADFLDDESYARHAGAQPARPVGRLRAGAASVAELGGVLCLVVFVSVFVPLSRLMGRHS